MNLTEGDQVMRVFFSAGDASGDMYAAAAASRLLKLRPDWQLEGIGGMWMQQAGVRLWGWTPAFSAFGAWSGLRMGVRFWTLFQRVRRKLSENPPDLFVPVDFGAFNRRLLPLARKGVRVFYFVPPSFWGVPPQKLRRYAHPNIVFAPIYHWQREKLQQAGAQVMEFGHPLLDILQPLCALASSDARARLGLPYDCLIVALFPGSRLTTVQENLPVLLQVAQRLNRRASQLHFAVGLPPDWRTEWLNKVLRRHPVDLPLSVHIGHSHELLKGCDVAVLVAGTVTLEAACLAVPSVAIFWLSWLNRLQGHWMRWGGIPILQYGPFALPNRILGEIVMPEFIGWAVHPDTIAETVWKLLTDDEQREAMRKRLAQVWQALGEPGATERVAKFLVEWLLSEG